MIRFQSRSVPPVLYQPPDATADAEPAGLFDGLLRFLDSGGDGRVEESAFTRQNFPAVGSPFRPVTRTGETLEEIEDLDAEEIPEILPAPVPQTPLTVNPAPVSPISSGASGERSGGILLPGLLASTDAHQGPRGPRATPTPHTQGQGSASDRRLDSVRTALQAGSGQGRPSSAQTQPVSESVDPSAARARSFQTPRRFPAPSPLGGTTDTEGAKSSRGLKGTNPQPQGAPVVDLQAALASLANRGTVEMPERLTISPSLSSRSSGSEASTARSNTDAPAAPTNGPIGALLAEQRGVGQAEAARGLETASPARVISQIAAPIQHVALGKVTADSITVHLNPPDLGRVEIDVRGHGSQDRGVDIVLRAERPGTERLLDLHLPELRQTLEQRGVDLGGLALDSSGSDRAGNRGGDAAESGSEGPSREDLHEDSESPLGDDGPALATASISGGHRLNLVV